MPRVCILTQYFPPEMGAPQGRLSELGSRLIQLGWEVDVLTALPNYPTGRVFDEYRGRGVMHEALMGMNVARVPLYTAKVGFARRLACYFSFAGSAALHGPKVLPPPDVIWVESPPLFIGLAARWLSWRWGCPYVFNVSDLWPESVIRMGMVRRGVATRIAEALEESLYRRAAAVTGQSEEIVQSVLARQPETRAVVITNGVDPERFGEDLGDASARAMLGHERGPVFLYAGLMGHAQGLGQVLDLAARLPEEIPGRIVLVGDGPEREDLARRVEVEGLNRVRILPAVPRHRIPALLSAADVAMVTLGARIPGAVPSKIYEAMASRRPILLVAEGEAARRVREQDCGICVDPGDASGLFDAFRSLATDPSLRRRLGSNGRLAAQTVYSRDVIVGALDSLLREVVADNGHSLHRARGAR